MQTNNLPGHRTERVPGNVQADSLGAGHSDAFASLDAARERDHPHPWIGDQGLSPGPAHLRRAVHLLWWISALGGMLAATTLFAF